MMDASSEAETTVSEMYLLYAALKRKRKAAWLLK